jgi:hypothetical protein
MRFALNLNKARQHQPLIGFILRFLLIFLSGYLAWRAIRGGFERPQWGRLNGYGIFACVLAVILAVWWVAHFVGQGP